MIWLSVYLATTATHLAQIPVADLTVQAVFQGIVVTIIALILYVRSVAILGASGGAAFGALVPALTAFIAIPLLGEWPSDIGWVAILLISAGVYLASGGPLPGSQPTGTLMIMTKPTSVAISTPAAHAQPSLSAGRVAGEGPKRG